MASKDQPSLPEPDSPEYAAFMAQVSSRRAIRPAVWILTLFIQLVTVIGVLGLLVVMLLTFSGKGIFSNSFFTSLSVVSPDGAAPSFEGMDWQVYSEVSLTSAHPGLGAAKTFYAAAASLTFLAQFMMAGIVFLFVLSFQMQKPFMRFIRTGLAVISGSLAVLATIVPWLKIKSDQIFVDVLELPTRGILVDDTAENPICTVCEWVSYPYYDFVYATDWLLLGLSVVLAFVAISYKQAKWLETEMESVI